jgi:hypothetical protein
MLTTRKASVAAAGLFLLVGCSDQPATAPNSGRFDQSAAISTDRSGGEKQQVTGHAFYLVAAEQNAFEAYSLSAVRHHEGSITGEVQIKSAIGDGFRIHGKIACFTISGNTARLAAKVTKSTNRNVVAGAYLFWSLVDNGEGREAEPDMSSQFFLADETLALYHCASGVTIPALYPVEHGNLQVHS